MRLRTRAIEAIGEGGGISIGFASETTIDKNIIANNSAEISSGGVSFYHDIASSTFKNNLVYNNTAPNYGGMDIARYREENGSLSLLLNTFSQNKSTMSSSSNISFCIDVGAGPGQPNINFNYNNLMFNNASYELFNASKNTAQNLNAANNYWGTSIDSEIQSKIYDWFDDASKGLVDYSAFLTSPETTAPISPPSNLHATIEGNNITLTWSPNPESDLKGYIVYWDTKGAYAYANSINVGNVTDYTLMSLSPGKYYIAVTAYDNDYNPAHDDPATIIDENQTNGNESWFSEIVIDTAESISTPTIPSGPTNGTTGTSYSYSTGGSNSSLGHTVEYQFDWKGDGSDLSPWGLSTQSKTWAVAGTYNVRARARCATDTSVLSSWSGGSIGYHLCS